MKNGPECDCGICNWCNGRPIPHAAAVAAIEDAKKRARIEGMERVLRFSEQCWKSGKPTMPSGIMRLIAEECAR